MKTTQNTILITGGGTGIGRGLAESFHALGNQVIISGRSAKSLEETVAANPGMTALTLDISDPASITDFASRIEAEFPALNVVINNAGIMRPENVREGGVADAEAMVITNLLGPIRLTAALLPLLERQPQATIMTVSSGLAFLPLSMTPTYCATKAAIHSYSQSLRYQLKETTVEVLELVPPYVQTTLMGDQQAADPRAMPLDEFLVEVMEIIAAAPASGEIRVQRVNPLRHAASNGEDAYQKQWISFNDAMAGGHD